MALLDKLNYTSCLVNASVLKLPMPELYLRGLLKANCPGGSIAGLMTVIHI